MSVTVKHPFVSAVADSADTSLVRPSNWNADHTIIGLGTAAELNAGVANGVATLDAGGKVPVSELPAAVLGALSYQGTWNASTNTPTLASGVGVKGYYYVVSVAGSTNLDGVTDWVVGDWAVFNGTVWQKVDNTDAVTSVNGQTGTVVLTQSDISGTVPTTRTITASTGLTGGGDLSADRTFAIDSTVATLTGTQTLTNKTLTSPKANEILDTNGNEILGLSPTASATDFLTVKNGIGVGVPLHIYADGSSANIGLHIQPKGTGLVTISDGTDFNKGIRFRSSGSAASAVTLLDAVSTAGRVVTLPDATTTLVGRDTTDTLTNKSISGSTNTLSNIGNASLTNSAITINGTSTSLGGSISVGTVTSVTGTAPVVSSGGNTPAISMAAATTSVDGYLTSTDWNTFNNKTSNTGTVTSVGGTGTVNGITLTGTVTTSGNLTLGGTLSGVSLTTQVSGTLPVANGGTGTATAFTAGSVVFAGASGVYSQDNASLFFDNTNDRLGVGTTTPQAKLSVSNGGAAGLELFATNPSGGVGTYIQSFNRSGGAYVETHYYATSHTFRTSASATSMVLDTSGNLGIGTGSPNQRLQVTGSNSTGFAGATLQNSNANVGLAGVQFSSDTTYSKSAIAQVRENANGAGPLVFYVDSATDAANWAAGDEKMRISAAGDVGIGTSSPSTYGKLAVQAQGNAIVARSASTNYCEIAVQSGAADAVKGQFQAIEGATNKVIIGSRTNHPVAFNINDFERMRLDASGNLLVGTTSSSDNTNGAKLEPSGTAGAPTVLKIMKTASGGFNGLLNYSSGSYVGGINFDNTSTSFPTSSDIRLKKDIVDAPSATQKIDNIRIVSHGWKHDDAVVDFGIIAQELVSVAPNAVMQGDDGEEVVTTWSVDYSKLVPLLIKAHQEQQTLITQLQADVATLKGN
jgi:hypothetical protein